MKFAHPRIAAYARFVVEVTYGVCFLWMFGFLAFVVLWEDVHLISYDGAVAGTAGLTVLLALVAVWMRVFALRHLLRLRSVWQPPKTQSL